MYDFNNKIKIKKGFSRGRECDSRQTDGQTDHAMAKSVAIAGIAAECGLITPANGVYIRHISVRVCRLGVAA